MGRCDTMIVYQGDREVVINVEHFEFWEMNGWSKKKPSKKAESEPKRQYKRKAEK